jgi:hypothetical protein
VSEKDRNWDDERAKAKAARLGDREELVAVIDAYLPFDLVGRRPTRISIAFLELARRCKSQVGRVRKFRIRLLRRPDASCRPQELGSKQDTADGQKDREAAPNPARAKRVLTTHGESGRSGVGRTRNVVASTSLAGQFEQPYGPMGPPTLFTIPVLRYMKTYA